LWYVHVSGELRYCSRICALPDYLTQTWSPQKLDQGLPACLYAEYVGKGHLISRGRVKGDMQRARCNDVSHCFDGGFLGIVELEAVAPHVGEGMVSWK
jgi:hypothetical protein